MSKDYNLQDQLDFIRKQAEGTDPYRIELKETSDHKNIMLYTDLNKRVGPLHPNNAEKTAIRWNRSGIRLYTKPRTEEQIKAFKQTDEYKIAHDKHLKLREKRHSMSKKGQNEKLVKDLAEIMAGAVHNHPQPTIQSNQQIPSNKFEVNVKDKK